MLSNTKIVSAVADALSKYSIPIILDPVIVSSSGHRLLSIDAIDTIKERLLPMATLLTPNIPEMIALTNMPLASDKEKIEAARLLTNYGINAILLKGGHEEGEIKRDILYIKSKGEIQISYLSSPTINTNNIHGTGCTLSSAIAAFIARGLSLEEAIAKAKEYITDAIRHGANIEIGKGYGPVNHSFNPLKMMINDF